MTDDKFFNVGGGLRIIRPSIPGPLVPDPTFDLIRCRFEANRTIGFNSFAGGFGLSQMPATAVACTFVNNGARYGSAIATDRADLAVHDAAIIGNTAQYDAAIYVQDNTATISNTLIARNERVSDSGIGGAAICGVDDAVIRIDASTIAENEGGEGGAVALCSFGIVARATVDISNSVIWGNSGNPDSGAEVTVPSNRPHTIEHSCIDGLPKSYVGTGNTESDPRFRDPLGPDRIPATEDDDFRLTAASPCVDAGNNDLLTMDRQFDLDGRPRQIDAPLTPDTGNGFAPIVDMGAYEFQPGDTNDDFIVNLFDYAAWSACTTDITAPNCTVLDFDGDNDIDLIDFAGFQIAFND